MSNNEPVGVELTEGERALIASAEAEHQPVHVYSIPDSPKMLRETLSVAQSSIPPEHHRGTEHRARLQRLIDECERKRPTGSDAKHGNRHTPECGCDDQLGYTVTIDGDTYLRLLRTTRQSPTVGLDVETVRAAVDAGFRAEVMCGPGCMVAGACVGCVTDAVVAADPRRTEAEVKAEALREAADALGPDSHEVSAGFLPDWLRKRADQITGAPDA